MSDTETKESNEKNDELEKNYENDIPEKILNQIKDLDSDLQENYTVLSRKIRIYIFSLFLILSVVVDLESGIFNSSVDILQKDLEMNNAQYGLFVSISFTGRIIGLVIFMVLLNFKHRKFTLITSIFLHGSSYGLYQISNNSYLLIFAKMFAAGNKVCATIYRPVWIEQFGLSKYKSIFFSLVQIMSSYGQIIGFNLGSFLFQENWKLGLLSILIIMYIIGIGFLVCPGKYFHRSYMYYEDKLVDTDDKEKNELEKENSQNERAGNYNINSNLKKSNNNAIKKKRGTVFVDSEKIKNQAENTEKTFKEKIIDMFKELLFLIKNKIYLLSVIKRANITFILQIVHSYLKPYQIHTLDNPDEDLLVLFYSLSTLVSGAVGGLIGGIITKKLGGYENAKSIYIMIIPEILTTITITFLAFTKDFYIYNINLMLFFCFISMGSPVIQGYLINAIPKSIKGIGVGLDMIISTFLGKIPGPVIYGALEDKYKEVNPPLAWRICMCYFYVGVIAVFYLCYCKYKQSKVNKSYSDNPVNVNESIVNLAAITSGTDTNDLFSVKMPVPKRSKSVRYHLKNINEDNSNKEKAILSPILENNETEDGDGKETESDIYGKSYAKNLPINNNNYNDSDMV